MELRSKPFKSIDEQIEILKNRGMEVASSEFAAQWLKSVGYYRLSGYWFVYRQSRDRDSDHYDQFIEGTRFEDVADLYEFDRKLRILILDGVERVEVGLRSKLAYHLAAIDPLAHEDASIFINQGHFNYLDWKRTAFGRISRGLSKSPALKHHVENHNSVFPIWLLLDVADFKDLSVLFDGLPIELQKQILNGWGIQLKTKGFKQSRSNPFSAWFHQLSLLRNYSAHHAKIWNSNFTPANGSRLADNDGLEVLGAQSDDIFGALTMLMYLVEQVSPASSWPRKVNQLIRDDFSKLKDRNLSEMGFPLGWESSCLWSSN